MSALGKDTEWQRWQRETLDQGFALADAQIRQQEQTCKTQQESEAKLRQEKVQIQDRIASIDAILAASGKQTDRIGPVLKRQREELDTARSSADDRVKKKFLMNFEPSVWLSGDQCDSPAAPVDTLDQLGVVSREEGRTHDLAMGNKPTLSCRLCRQVVPPGHRPMQTSRCDSQH